MRSLLACLICGLFFLSIDGVVTSVFAGSPNLGGVGGSSSKSKIKGVKGGGGKSGLRGGKGKIVGAGATKVTTTGNKATLDKGGSSGTAKTGLKTKKKGAKPGFKAPKKGSKPKVAGPSSSKKTFDYHMKPGNIQKFK
jgi:hypothetical protein